MAEQRLWRKRMETRLQLEKSRFEIWNLRPVKASQQCILAPIRFLSFYWIGLGPTVIAYVLFWQQVVISNLLFRCLSHFSCGPSPGNFSCQRAHWHQIVAGHRKMTEHFGIFTIANFVFNRDWKTFGVENPMMRIPSSVVRYVEHHLNDQCWIFEVGPGIVESGNSCQHWNTAEQARAERGQNGAIHTVDLVHRRCWASPHV